MRSAPRRAGSRAATVLLTASAVLGAPLGHAAAAGYEMITTARYEVDPAAGAVAVTVAVTFRNTTPDPAGQTSLFPVIELAVQPGAASVTATDAEGELAVAVEEQETLTKVSVTPREPVGFDESVAFELRFLLPDGAASGLHVRPELVAFDAWGFGTASQVTVELPGGLEVRADGDPLQVAASGDPIILESGPITDPAHWLARLTALGSARFDTLSASIPLQGGTVDLQVRHWASDPEWGTRVRDLLVRALPALESAVGLPYPHVGPLVVVESAPGVTDAPAEPIGTNAEIAIAIDAPPFTVLHQAAHVWIDERLASERWIREGLASHLAGAVALGLGVEMPFDPAQRSGELQTAAFPLDQWGAALIAPEASDYGYATSWALTERLALAIGEERLQRVLGRIAAGVGAYVPASAPLPTGDTVATPVDSRRWLDHLEQLSGAQLAPDFAALVFEPATAALLDQRTAARDQYAQLLTVAGDWGPPTPVVVSLSDWRFDEAGTRIDLAVAWLAERDALIAQVEAAGLTLPDRLRDDYLDDGGGERARAELEAERAVVEAYQAARRSLAAHAGPLETIGLLGTRPPGDLLDEAGALFGEGDLRAATNLLDEATRQLESALSGGLVRVAGASAMALAAIGLTAYLIRRRRGSHYTAAP